MKKTIFSLAMLCLAGMPCCAYAATASEMPTMAQQNKQDEISVVRFQRLTNDITARVTAPKRDQNNEPCAIIKVVTRDKALFFEPDALGITAREDQPGEIWLYVPHGARRITIKHERFGVIRNYFYGESIDKATVYELILDIPKETAANTGSAANVTEQTLMMNYSPNNAKVYIDGVLQQTIDNGAHTAVFGLGTHNYRIEAAHHKTVEGSFSITGEHATVLNVSLKPEFGIINATSNKTGTTFTLDGKTVATDAQTFNSDTLATKTYVISAEKKWYVPQTKEVNVGNGKIENIEFKLKPQKPSIFAFANYGVADFGNDNLPAYGITVGAVKKYGCYASSLINITTDGGYSRTKQFSFTAGGVMRISKPLYLQAGAGYVEYEGNDDENNDFSGMLYEAGLILRHKFLAVNLRYAYNFNSYQELRLGIGIFLGKY